MGPLPAAEIQRRASRASVAASSSFPPATRENDDRCARFALADDWLRFRGLQREGRVGHAHARLARARDIVAVAVDHLAGDRLVFPHSPAARCAECDEARASVGTRTEPQAEFRST